MSATDIECAHCGASVGKPCVSVRGETRIINTSHYGRSGDARRAASLRKRAKREAIVQEAGRVAPTRDMLEELQRQIAELKMLHASALRRAGESSRQLRDGYHVLSAIVRAAGGEVKVDDDLFELRDMLEPVEVDYDTAKRQRVYRVRPMRRKGEST